VLRANLVSLSGARLQLKEISSHSQLNEDKVFVLAVIAAPLPLLKTKD
jgi:hypothetical protein